MKAKLLETFKRLGITGTTILLATTGIASACLVHSYTAKTKTEEPLEFSWDDSFDVSYPGQSDKMVIGVKNKAPDVEYGISVETTVEKDQITDINYSVSGDLELIAQGKKDNIYWAKIDIEKGGTGDITEQVTTAPDAKPGEVELSVDLNRKARYTKDSSEVVNIRETNRFKINS